MQQDTYKTTAYPKFGGFPSANTPAGTKMGDVNGLFDSIMTLVQKNAITAEAAHVACGSLISAWGTVKYALEGKAPSNG